MEENLSTMLKEKANKKQDKDYFISTGQLLED